jgi:acetyl-CoA synthetase (ADP-forming)
MGLIDFQKSVELLKQYGFPLLATKPAVSEKEALSVAKATGFPLVLKAFSPDILHRTEIGAVRTGIKDEKELKEAYKSISKFGQVLVQKEIEGTEISLGMKRDPQFGPVLMAGLGGIFIDVLKDVSFRVAPINGKEALEMLRSLKSWPIFQGYRGKKALNVQAIVSIIVKLSIFSLKEEGIREIDFNPVMADGNKAEIVDFKFLS